jgi:hypothetical protein
MNLGDIYLKTFAAIVAMSFIAALVSASMLRFWRCSWRTVIYAALPVWLALSFFALDNWHQRLFAAWHQRQNSALPKDGCLTYEPDFYRLYATYKMTRNEFDAWVKDHPWRLHLGSNGLLHHDGPQFGLDSPESTFETDMAPNGKQLRVYFKSGIMYASYNSN